MSLKNPLVLVVLFFSLNGSSQNRIQIIIPSAEEEAEYIWQTIQDISFFDENNYQLSLPKGSLIESLKNKAKNGTLSDTDRTDLIYFVKDSIYRKADYEKGYTQISVQADLINRMIREISRMHYDWRFKKFDLYQIKLTLYGPGGSYDPEDGSVLIFTTNDGQFKNYQNPANTIIHEIIHIGMEESIMQAYPVPHALKERIVDTFVFLNFATYLPDYQIQNMGETRIDSYLKTKGDLVNLEEHVKSIFQTK